MPSIMEADTHGAFFAEEQSVKGVTDMADHTAQKWIVFALTCAGSEFTYVKP